MSERNAGRALTTSNLELLERDRLRETFLANLAHDLRTPLTAINGAAANLLDDIAGALSTDQREYVDIVRHHAARLASTVNELLDGARVQAREVQVQLESIDVHALVRDIVAGLQPVAREHRIQLEVRGREARAVADADKLQRAVENLVSNALKFTDEEGRVTVEVMSTVNAVEITVRDTGHGIPADEMPRLFERFFRGSARRPGTGLGLSIARDLVRLHGGDITVTSEVNRGSEFRVWLPREARTMKTSVSGPRDDGGHRRKRPRRSSGETARTRRSVEGCFARGRLAAR
jgi:two-component system sensor histidine kinase ResE